MKTTGNSKLVAGLLALCCISCAIVPEQEFFKGRTVRAVTEGAPTKTKLEGSDENGYEVVWSEQDSIKIRFASATSKSDPLKFTLVAGEGTALGDFAAEQTPELSSYDSYEAFYAIEDGEWPTIQKYCGKDVISNAPMRASGTVEGELPDRLEFKNLGGILRLTVKGGGTLRFLTVLSNDVMSGPVAGYSKDGAAQIDKEEGSKYIHLDMGEKGVDLGENGIDFYIAMPERTEEMGGYTGFFVEFEYTDETSVIKQLGKPLVINRGQITPAAIAGIANEKDVWFRRTPYGKLTREWQAGDSLRYWITSWDPQTYIAANSGREALFTGASSLKFADGTAILAASPIRIQNDSQTGHKDMPAVTLPSQQKIEDGGIDPAAEISVAKVDVESTEADPSEMQNLCAIISFEISRPMKKVVFIANDGAFIAGDNMGMLIEWNETSSEWDLLPTSASSAKPKDKITVTSATEGGSFSKVMIYARPAVFENGYTIECYDKASLDEPSFSKLEVSSLTTKAGEVTDLGLIEDPVGNILYARYSELNDYVYLKNGKKVSSADPIKTDSPELQFLQGLDYDYTEGDYAPVPGQTCDLHIFFQGRLDADETPKIDGKPTVKTGEYIVIDDVPCYEYVLKDFVVGGNDGLPLTVTVTANHVKDMPIYMPYAWPIKEVTLLNMPKYACLCTDEYRFAKFTGKNYDCNLMTDDFDLATCMWKVKKNDGKVTVFQSGGGKTYWLQYQPYRAIGYISRDAVALDDWAQWTIVDGDLTNRGRTLFSSTGTEVVCGSVDAAKDELRLMKMAKVEEE